MSEHHPTQYDHNGKLLPNWPGASHFRDWFYLPLTLNGKSVDLYFWLNTPGKHSYVSTGDLLIGIQCSDEDGDYLSPFIESGNALHNTYVKGQAHDVIFAYYLACKYLGLKPAFSE